MSDYVRIKAVRYKIPEEIIVKIKKENEDFWTDSIEEYYNKEEKLINTEYRNTINNLNIGSGLNFNTDEYEFYIDYILHDEYGASSGDFESVRMLTPTEDKKYIEIFKKVVPNIKPNELRYVDYCYYNGVDEPAVWELEEI